MILQGVILAAALIAAASVQTPKPAAFAAIPPLPTRGAHCADGGGRAIDDPVGKDAYIRQETQIVSMQDQHLLGYVYAASDGNDYVDVSPTVPNAPVRLALPGEFPWKGAFLRPCFADAWTRPWGEKR